jgi:hypothetical protein
MTNDRRFEFHHLVGARFEFHIDTMKVGVAGGYPAGASTEN